MKRLLRKILLVWRPLDARLRRVRGYAWLSAHLQRRYRAAMGFKADQRAYTDGFDTIMPRADTILFECYWGKKFGDHPLALYRALCRSRPTGPLRIYWVAAPQAVLPAEITDNPDVLVVQTGTAAYAQALLEAGALVNNVTFPPWFIRRPGQRYLNTWHGVPMKAMGRDMAAPLVSMANTQRNFLQADLILDLSDYYRWATIRPYDVAQLVAPALLRSGAPRVDDTLHCPVPVADLRARYGIAEGQRVVLFAPTWRGNSTAIAAVFDEQAQLYGEIARRLGPEWFVLFSAHQMVRVSDAGPVANGALIGASDNINDVLSVIDVLVSDYSSILFDFLPLDRPIVLHTPDIAAYSLERGLYLQPAELPCAETRDVAALIAAIRAGRRPSDFAGFAEMRARFIPEEDGQAAPRALAALMAPQGQGGAAAQDGRKRVLIAPGGMLPNGITSSLKGLIANLDYDRFDPYILLDAPLMGKDASRMAQFRDFDPRCNWILRVGDMLLSAEESPVYHRFRTGADLLSDAEMAQVATIFARENRRLLGEARFDLAIEFGGYAPYWTGLIACANAARKVCYQHNHLWAEYTNADAARDQKQLFGVFQTYRWFDQLVAVSEETRAVNAEHLGRFYPPGLQSLTVRNTLDVRRVAALAAQSVAEAHPEAAALFEGPAFRFIALGRLSPEKRHDRLIAAFARIASAHPDALLMICGTGPLEDEVQAQIRKLGLGARVHLLGQVANPYPLLEKADICVMSSDYEGQPMVLLEALCLGTPCIGTDIPGIRAVLKEGRGQLVPADEGALAEAMAVAVQAGRHRRQDRLGEAYAAETMQEFYRIVCGQAV
jgi:CDP-glycerol glycerophosphotransferase